MCSQQRKDVKQVWNWQGKKSRTQEIYVGILKSKTDIKRFSKYR